MLCEFVLYFHILPISCSMTFCFSFEVFITLNPIQVNMKRGGPTYYYKAKRRDESRTITS